MAGKEERDRKKLLMALKRRQKVTANMLKKSDGVDSIYVVKCENYHKIGIAANVKGRVDNLQCGNPFKIHLVFSKKSEWAKMLEVSFHELFKSAGKHHMREWFILNDKDIQIMSDIMDEVARKMEQYRKCKKQADQPS